MSSSQFPIPKTIGKKEPDTTYTSRQAIRVIAFNSAGSVAIIYAERDNYYKLPGGGIDPGEDHDVAARREMQEETGGLIKLQDRGCIATVEEFRNDLHQISYCYVADLIDGSGEANLTEDEIADKLKPMWLPVNEAKRLMAAAEPTSTLGKYIKERDIYLLNEGTK
jgi:8-oxo-dGTP diphosphatase